MKLAVVSPRFGPQIFGGAEAAARMLALRLAERDGWDVVALTTCATDHTTWANDVAAGTKQDGAVTVHRFPTTQQRSPDFDALSSRVLTRRMQQVDARQHEWLLAQGPVSPELIDAIRTTDADVVAFHPYLYHPTVMGMNEVRGRGILHAAAHDEAALTLPLYRDVFAQAGGLVHWTDTERRLVESKFRVGSHRQLVLGIGVDPAPPARAFVPPVVELGDRPFLLCLGRVENGKGASVLARAFTEYKARRPGPLALVFAGQVVHPPEPHPDVFVTGGVDDDTKWDLLRNATVFVSPSAYESFAIVLLEAWSVGTPALVNGLCAVTREHAEHSGGALAFKGYADFESTLDRVLADEELRTALAENGRAYVDQHYQWDDLITRYADFCTKVAANA